MTPQPEAQPAGQAGPVVVLPYALTQCCQGPIWLVLFLLGMSGQQHRGDTAPSHAWGR